MQLYEESKSQVNISEVLAAVSNDDMQKMMQGEGKERTIRGLTSKESKKLLNLGNKNVPKKLDE